MQRAGRQNETTRQACLAALGIQLWFPTRHLPNAQPPRPLSAITPLTGRAHPSDRTQPGPEPANVAADASSARQLLSIRRNAESSQAPTPEQQPSQALQHQKSFGQTVESRRFKLAVLTINKHCLAVTDTPHAVLEQFSQRHQRLLLDILRAIQIVPDHLPLTISEFNWPLGSQGLMAHMSQDDQAATDAIQAYLNHRFELKKRSDLLLFGRSAARFVTGSETPFDNLRGLHHHQGQRRLVTFSLNELMKQPSLKAEAWKNMRSMLAVDRSVT